MNPPVTATAVPAPFRQGGLSTAIEMYDCLTSQMAEQEGITERLKATDQMEWVHRINNIHNRAAEIVYKELIYV